jgi:hypothetical protein
MMAPSETERAAATSRRTLSHGARQIESLKDIPRIHDNIDTGGEHDVSGLRIVGDIGLGPGAHIAATTHSTAHQDNAFETRLSAGSRRSATATLVSGASATSVSVASVVTRRV